MSFVVAQLNAEPTASIVNLTTTGLAWRESRGGSINAHFDVVLAETPVALCWFWNQRAIQDATVRGILDFGRRVVVLRSTQINAKSFQDELFDLVRGRLQHPALTSDWDINFFLEDGDEAGQRFIEESERDGLIRPLRHLVDELETDFRYSSTGELIAPDRIVQGEPLTYTVNRSMQLPNPYKSGLPGHVQRPYSFQPGQNALLSPAPSRPFDHISGHFYLDVESDLWERYPATKGMAQRIHQTGSFTHYGLSVGFASRVPKSASEVLFQVRLPRDEEALGAFFEDQGYQIAAGPAVRHVNALLGFSDGLTEINLYRRRSVIRLLELMTAKSSVEQLHDAGERASRVLRAASMEEAASLEFEDALADVLRIADSTVARSQVFTFQHLNRAFMQLPDIKKMPNAPKLLHLLDALVRRRIVVRGFLVRCEWCSMPNWHPLGEVDERIRCPGCRRNSYLPVRSGHGEQSWQYSLNTTVSHAINHGALAPVATLAMVIAGEGEWHSHREWRIS